MKKKINLKIIKNMILIMKDLKMINNNNINLFQKIKILWINNSHKQMIKKL